VKTSQLITQFHQRRNRSVEFRQFFDTMDAAVYGHRDVFVSNW
jgi:hypothetical protein